GGGEEEGDGETWEPPVLTTVAVQGTGVAELADALDRHHASLAASGGLAARRRQRLVARTRAVLERGLRRWLDDVAAGRRSPYDVAAEILGQLKTGASR